MAALPKELSLEEAIYAVREAVSLFDEDENVAKMEAVRKEAGGDFMKLMNLVLPVATSIQSPIAMKYGFSGDHAGVMEFAMATKKHESNPEIAALLAALKAKYLPFTM